MKLPYVSLVNYSPTGSSKKAVESRRIRGNVKSARHDWILQLIRHCHEGIAPLFDAEATLVPIPRSSPLQRETPWPARTIADILVAEGLAANMALALERHTAIRKSSTCKSADERPFVPEHIATLRAHKGVLQTPRAKITLVDDVVTLGRTGIACALVLKQACPKADIQLFSILRTKSLKDDIDRLVDPSTGMIHGSRRKKRTKRDPEIK